jgi:hypothetical protein
MLPAVNNDARKITIMASGRFGEQNVLRWFLAELNPSHSDPLAIDSEPKAMLDRFSWFLLE